MKRTPLYVSLLLVVVLGISACAEQAPPAITFTAPDPLPPATVGVPYQFTFGTADNPAGGNPPYTFMLGSGVGFPPFGLILDVNGLLNGTPTAAGTREFGVCVKDMSGNQACATTSLTVAPAPPAITFTAPDPLPPATVGVPYQFAFGTADSPAGGNPPYTFMLGSGVGFPPFGLILDVNGLLNGTPTAAGTREFEICVKDMSGNQACATTSLTVVEVPSPPIVTEETTVTISSATCEAVRFSWGGIMYIDVSVSGNASGPVGTRLILPAVGIPSETPEEYSCGDWGDNCRRDDGEPPTTNWAVRGSATVGEYVGVVYANGVSAEVVLDCTQ